MNVPPLVYSATPSAKDYLTHGGAEVLAAKMKAAWRRAGHDVEAIVEPCNLGTADDPHVIFTVRTPGLVNGLPVR